MKNAEHNSKLYILLHWNCKEKRMQNTDHRIQLFSVCANNIPGTIDIHMRENYKHRDVSDFKKKSWPHKK